LPTVLRWRSYKAFFYSNEGHEPPHVHVESNGREAKFWLDPIEEAANRGFTAAEIRAIAGMLKVSRLQLMSAWKEHFREQ
jgi:hypothetical protein